MSANKSYSSSTTDLDSFMYSDIYKLDSKAKTSVMAASRKNMDGENF